MGIEMVLKQNWAVRCDVDGCPFASTGWSEEEAIAKAESDLMVQKPDGRWFCDAHDPDQWPNREGDIDLEESEGE